MTPPTWAPARQVWRLLRAARRVTRRVTGWPAGPGKFEAVLDAIARRGEGWISEEHPVARVLATRTTSLAWAAGADVAPRPWRWLVARDLAVVGGARRTRARFTWTAPGERPASVSWPIIADGGSRTYVVDLARSRWARACTVGALRFAPCEGSGTASLGVLALVGDLAQLERADARWPLAKRYIHGVGVECGALQNPLRVRRGTRVIYVDRLRTAEARQHYPELARYRLTSPEVIGDVHRLPIADRSVDFYIGNHLLEHSETAVAGLEEMLRVVRPGGVVYVSVPDAGNPLDRGRPVTPLAHHLDDHDPRLDRTAMHRAHYAEYVASAHAALVGTERADLTARWVAQRYSIHFHVFDEETFRELMRHVCDRIGAVLVELARNPGKEFDEHIAVLRRT